MRFAHLTHARAALYAVIIFLLTIFIAWQLPQHSLALSGLLVPIMFSVFVQYKWATIFLGCLSILVVLLFFAWNIDFKPVEDIWGAYAFVVVTLVFTTFIALYIKELFREMQFDKSHMTSLFENATEGIILADQNAEIVLVNPSACRMFGYEVSELRGKKVEVLLPDRFRGKHAGLRKSFYAHPQNREMGSGRDLFGQTKKGHNFPVEVSLSSYRQNNVQYVIAFVVDITHRKEIEERMLRQRQQLEEVTSDIRKLNTELEAKVEERTIILKEALQKLEQSQEELSKALDKERELSEIKSRFVSMASHEFRTPLSSVLSSASLLAKYTLADQQLKREKHITRIKDSVKHLNGLLDDFLSLGKLGEGKVSVQLSSFDISKVIHDTIYEVRGLVLQGQEIRYKSQGEILVNADNKLLKNILINLLSNALKFSGEENVVEVSSSIVDDMAVVCVKDSGIGISEEDQQHLFSSFFRGKNAVNIQGTGLGLHIVKQYADLMHAKLTIDSKLHIGTTVCIHFPIQPKTNDHEDFSY